MISNDHLDKAIKNKGKSPTPPKEFLLVFYFLLCDSLHGSIWVITQFHIHFRTSVIILITAFVYFAVEEMGFIFFSA